MTSNHWPSMRPTLIDYGRLLDGITLEGELLAQFAASAGPDLEVPGRPGITVADTVLLTGTAYRRALAWIRHGEQPDEWQRPPVEGAGDVIAFHTDGRRELVAELSAHRPDEPCATWWPAHRTYGFWRRRMAHETAVHRVDVQAAAGVAPTPVDPDFAADGIDETLLLWFGHQMAERNVTATESGAVGVEAAGRAWLAILSRARSSARRAPAVDARAADALVTGDPMNVYLWLWGRVPDQAVDTTGDFEASAQLWGLLRLATPTTIV
ncbi:MAG TPA: maleylpyruvate isomerase N-terminal domain-containing protein [Pseudonocardiaceae bacterium]